MLTLINLTLLFFLVVVAIAVIRTRNLLAATMLLGIYSLLSASIFVTLDAVDVAFTEAAVGAGISTILALSTLSMTTWREKENTFAPWIPLVVCTITGVALLYATFDMPWFGDANAPIHQHVAPYYLQESYEEMHIPNVVTSVLASYRGFDTFGETVVVFTALVGVLLLIGGNKSEDREFLQQTDESDHDEGES